MPSKTPKRIIRSGKPAKCPECGNKKFLIVVYGMPTQKVWDDTGRYDCRGCCLPPFVEVDKNDYSRKPHKSAYWFGNISKTNNLSN